MNHLFFLFGIMGLVILTYALKRGKLTDLLGAAAMGAAAFFAANLAGEAIGVHIPLNAFTAAVFLLGGAPGAICLHLLHALFG